MENPLTKPNSETIVHSFHSLRWLIPNSTVFNVLVLVVVVVLVSAFIV
jgi:hypothetical protein